jgi:hypothetical protein
MIEKYLNDTIQRKPLEKKIIEGNLLDRGEAKNE